MTAPEEQYFTLKDIAERWTQLSGNICTTSDVLHYCTLGKLQAYVFASSWFIQGHAPSSVFPISAEEPFVEGQPLDPLLSECKCTDSSFGFAFNREHNGSEDGRCKFTAGITGPVPLHQEVCIDIERKGSFLGFLVWSNSEWYAELVIRSDCHDYLSPGKSGPDSNSMVLIHLEDLRITRQERDRFEQEHGISSGRADSSASDASSSNGAKGANRLPDYEYWAKLDYWHLEEAALLLCELDPDEHRELPGNLTPPDRAKVKNLCRLFEATDWTRYQLPYLAVGWGWDGRHDPLQYLAVALGKGVSIPDQLSRAMVDKYQQIVAAQQVQQQSQQPDTTAPPEPTGPKDNDSLHPKERTSAHKVIACLMQLYYGDNWGNNPNEDARQLLNDSSHLVNGDMPDSRTIAKLINDAKQYKT